ncbi:hypothetical protein JRQ81_019298 [Phrynocephalus forsythii]|uniref:Uncharacterized protein n=1 Tax=Phrynocephalus forsythii TaxID=171643 RepID=A0A9Q0XNN7_9SAUR|nr:hypothetical protein JRQ81_019298 [Phrynocephalus forsythii]
MTSNNEGHKLDLIGRCHYSLASFSLHTSNYLCAMEAYNRNLMHKLLSFIHFLPDDLRNKALSYHSEAMSLIDYEMIISRHAADATSKQIAMAIHFRRHAWLRNASIPDDARNRIEDSPLLPQPMKHLTT